MFIAAPSTIAKPRKQPKRPSTDEQMKYIYTYMYDGMLLKHKKD